jgi:hypothetical protein
VDVELGSVSLIHRVLLDHIIASDLDAKLNNIDRRKRKGHPATRAAFSSRENSSNGAKTVKTFWRNLMSPKRGVSRNFW